MRDKMNYYYKGYNDKYFGQKHMSFDGYGTRAHARLWFQQVEILNLTGAQKIPRSALRQRAFDQLHPEPDAWRDCSIVEVTPENRLFELPIISCGCLSMLSLLFIVDDWWLNFLSGNRVDRGLGLIADIIWQISSLNFVTSSLPNLVENIKIQNCIFEAFCVNNL